MTYVSLQPGYRLYLQHVSSHRGKSPLVCRDLVKPDGRIDLMYSFDNVLLFAFSFCVCLHASVVLFVFQAVDNISQNKILEYLMANNIFEPLSHVRFSIDIFF